MGQDGDRRKPKMVLNVVTMQASIRFRAGFHGPPARDGRLLELSSPEISFGRRRKLGCGGNAREGSRQQERTI